ncbi:MAG: sigma-70 family RNA polymerase sigma factor [Chloroflexi bacterium]|nr:sigma-70 family RNA polymerase sigma factor [Chloroflexota bacterium]
MTPTDGDLLEAIAWGDELSLASLYDRYHRLAFSLALRVVNDRGRAEDVVQDAFFSVWRKAGSYSVGRGSVKTWLTSIVRNRAIDVVRARRESDGDDEAVLLGLRDSSPSVIEQVTASLDRDTVRAAITVLPVEQRQVIAMAYFEGRSHSEIAGMTGLPLGTVKSRIRLGMHRLRDELVGIGFDMSAPMRVEVPAQISAA